MDAVDYADLPFNEAIEFFRGKVSLPTEKFTDLLGAAHSRAFVVAGAMRDDLLTDLRKAVAKAIEKGTSLQEFKKDFRGIAERYGWKHKGKPAWRAGVIYDTNLRQAYNAGREAQIMDPDSLAVRPWVEYVHSDASAVPRLLHLGWNGTVLPADDPWWDTHSPINGFG